MLCVTAIWNCSLAVYLRGRADDAQTYGHGHKRNGSQLHTSEEQTDCSECTVVRNTMDEVQVIFCCRHGVIRPPVQIGCHPPPHLRKNMRDASNTNPIRFEMPANIRTRFWRSSNDLHFFFS